jgi:hypothetical protein
LGFGLVRGGRTAVRFGRDEKGVGWVGEANTD